MNAELKALLKLAVDAVSASKDAIAKANFVTVLLPALYQMAADIPGVAANWADLKNEIAALKTQPAEADLLAYVVASVAGVTSNAHAQAVVSAALVMVEHLVQDGLALDQAIKAPPSA